VFEASGSITFDVLLPFDVEWIYFTYETISESIMFTITTDEPLNIDGRLYVPFTKLGILCRRLS